jgi:hypothetical protein
VTFDDLQHTQGYRKRTVYRSLKLANLWPPATLYSSRQSHDGGDPVGDGLFVGVVA